MIMIKQKYMKLHIGFKKIIWLIIILVLIHYTHSYSFAIIYLCTINDLAIVKFDYDVN